MQTRDDEIEQLQALLSSATTYQSVDGQSASFDLNAANRRLAQLLQEQALDGQGSTVVPRNFQVDLSRF